MKSLKEFIPLWKLIKEEKVKLIIASTLILLAGISEIATGYLNGAAVESITNFALKNAVIYLGTHSLYEPFTIILDKKLSKISC